MIYLIEFQAAIGGVATSYRAASGNGFVTLPGDTPANTVYPARVINPGAYERHMWAPGSTTGRGAVSAGIIELANSDGALDALLDSDVDGQPVTVLAAPDGTTSRAAFAVAFAGQIESMAFSAAAVQINLRDRMSAVAALPLSTARYGGTNVLPAGVDGTPDDIAGQFIPRLFGDAQNFAPPCVNTSALIYQVSAGTMVGTPAVWAAGAILGPGTNRGTLAALQATAPTAGTVDWCPGSTTEGAYIRLGSSPGSAVVTVTTAEGSGAAARTVAQVAMRALMAAGVSSGDVAGMASFDSINSARVGYYVGTGGATVGDVLDSLCASAGATWAPTRAGAFRVQRLSDPATGAAPVAAFEPRHLLTTGGDPIALIPGDNNGVPAYEVSVDYARNWNVMQPSAVAGSVSTAWLTWLGQEYRTLTTTTPAVWDPAARTGRNPLSRPVRVATLLRLGSDALTEALRLAGLYGVRRRYVAFAVPPSAALAVDLGSIITLTAPRFGFDAGRRLAVVGMREDYGANETTLFCWG